MTFQVAYTFSKAENNTSLYNDQNNLSIDWARATFDRTHRLIANYDYQLPVPTLAKGFAGTMLKGWSIAGIVIIQSGLPMTLTDPKGEECTAALEFPPSHFAQTRRTPA